MVRWFDLNMPAEQPINIATFGSLVGYGYPMDVSCWRCERSVTIDAAAFPAKLSYIGRRFRCSCAEGCWPTISKPFVAREGA
jgi:hypothetical protein